MQISTIDIIKSMQDFILSDKKLEYKAKTCEKHLLIDFKDWIQYDHELPLELFDNPKDLMQAFEKAIEEIRDDNKNVKVRFIDVDKIPSTHIRIRDIRVEHHGKFKVVTGVIKHISEIYGEVISRKFECPLCGNILHVLQIRFEGKREPSRCGCGRKGKFVELEQIKIDAQKMVIEEDLESIEGNQQPNRLDVIMQYGLTSKEIESKNILGSRVCITGVILTRPKIEKGKVLNELDKYMECNYIKSLEDKYKEIKITPEDIEKIKEYSKRPDIIELFVKSYSPHIAGYENIKKAIILQLFGGVNKTTKDNQKIRGDIHILLIGDPACVCAGTKVALADGTLKNIEEFGEHTNQQINYNIQKIRKSPSDTLTDKAFEFYKYPNIQIYELLLETGKRIKCSYNQPFLTKQGWVRADELKINDKIRIAKQIKNTKKSYAKITPTNLYKKPKTYKENNNKSYLLDEDLAALFGYVLGDGYLIKKVYGVGFCINEEERDLLPKLREIVLSKFNKEPYCYNHKKMNSVIKGRHIIGKQSLLYCEINNKQVGSLFSWLQNKELPKEIFNSPLSVVSSFLRWLFEADGCCFGNGRGKNSIKLKSNNPSILQDTQLLLIQYGIQSRIIQNDLFIRRASDIQVFAKKIGFASIKKQLKLKSLLSVLPTKKIRGNRYYERIKHISRLGKETVYDISVPNSHQFIANGIVVHNTGKTKMAQASENFALKYQYASGARSTKAGITVTLTKDEFINAWGIEAGAVVLANNGICVLDEFDKMQEPDRDALHEQMSDQTITIQKATIHTRLTAKTSILACANWKESRFNPDKDVYEQIAMPDSLISRFDLYFIFIDLPNKEKDETEAKYMLRANQETLFEKELPKIEMLDYDFIKKYLIYAKNHKPKISEEVAHKIASTYAEIRDSVNKQLTRRVIPITKRQVEAFVRLSEASAKIRLRDVTLEDVEVARNLIDSSLRAVAFDSEAGSPDMDIIEIGKSSKMQNLIYRLRKKIDELSLQSKIFPIDELIKYFKDEEIQIEDLLEKLRKSGDIYEPKPGFIGKL